MISPKNRILPVGKLPNDLLARLLKRYIRLDPRVVVGPAVGEDAAAIRFGGRYLIAKTDPITFVTDEIGFYALHINANDLATMGAAPRWFLATVLLPERKTTPALAEKIFRQLSLACRSLGVSLCGGHTEITYGIDRPIVVGQMLGETVGGRLIRTAGAKAGDDLILTKGIAIEGTSIIARSFYDRVAGRFGKRFAQRCKNFLLNPGVSVLQDARIALAAGRVHAMHDPTEGGLSTGLYELAEAAGVGLRIEEDSIPIFRETRTLCEAFGLDPLGLIASGALLISLDARDTERVIKKLDQNGIHAVRIGRVIPREEGVRLRRQGRWRRLPRFQRDEVARLFK